MKRVDRTDFRRTRHPVQSNAEAHVIAGWTGTGPSRRPVPVGDAGIPLPTAPRPTAEYPSVICRCFAEGIRGVRIRIWPVKILTPLPSVPDHVVEAPRIGL